jgi:cell division protein FtsB
VTELKARLSEKTDRIDDLEAELSELRDENETLEARAAAVDEAESAFAAALAEHVPRDAEALQADLSLSQLREWLEDIDEASVEDAAAAEADVRSGAGTETATLSESDRERKQELEAKLSELDDKEGMLAEKERDRLEAELADLTGGGA